MKIIYTQEDQAVIDKINELIQDRSEEICRDYLLAIDYGILSIGVFTKPFKKM